MRKLGLVVLLLATPALSDDFIRYYPPSTARVSSGGEIAIGNGALPGVQGGGTYSGNGYNIAIGTSACAANTTGACTAVGFEAGMTNGAGND